MKKLLLLALLALSPAPLLAEDEEDGLGPALVDLRASTSPFSFSPGVDERYDRGMAYMYRLDFAKAEAEFRRIAELDPASPAGWFALAALSWWKYSQNFDSAGAFAEVERDFISNSDKVIELAGKMEREKRSLDQAYFYLGNAYGLQGRWYAVQRSWWKAYSRGKKGRKYLKKCVEVNPAVYDAFLGLGVFDYYAATLPGALGLGAKLFVGGDRQRGMDYVRLALEKGRFFRLEARFFLIEIYSRHEKDFPKAYEQCAALRASDPTNMLFRLAELMVHLQAQDWPGVLAAAEGFLGAWGMKEQKGLEQQLGSVYLAAGDALIGLKRFEEAVEWLTGGVEKTSFPEKGWVTYCLLRRAQAYDLLGRRAEALRDYKAAHDRPNFWDSRKYSRAGLKKAPSFGEVVRQMTED